MQPSNNEIEIFGYAQQIALSYLLCDANLGMLSYSIPSRYWTSKVGSAVTVLIAL